MMTVRDAVERVLDGHGILFVGAGFSRGAINLRGEELKTSKAFAEHLARKVELPPSTLLEDAAEEFLDTLGPDSLINELQQEFTVKKIQDYHRVVVGLPWKRVYTTNYDNVLKVARSAESKSLLPVVLSDNPHDMSKADTIAVHLNGYVERLTRDTLGSELKLTEVSYITASITDSQWVSLLRQDLRFAKAVVFLGYSLADLDVKRILFEDPDLASKCFFVVGDNADRRTVRLCSRFGMVVEESVEWFGGVVRETRKEYSVPDAPLLLGSCVEPYTEPSKAEEVTDEAVYNLLAFGDYDQGRIWHSQSVGSRYFLVRDTIEYLLAMLEGSAAAVVDADFGNGKTMFLEGLKFVALERGYRVFSIFDRSDDVFEELDVAFRLGGRLLFVLDDYPDAMDVIKAFGLRAPSNARLVLSARSLSNDVLIDDVVVALGDKDLVELSLDRLSDTELRWVQDLLDEFGLWGEMAAWSKRRKWEFLVRTCRREFHAVLLKILAAPQIVQKLQGLVGKIKSNPVYYRILVSVLILSVLNHRPDLSKLADFWGVSVVNSKSFRRHAGVNQFVRFDRGGVVVRSPVASQYILREVVEAGVVTETLKEMARVADKLSRISREHRSLCTALMRFGNLQYVFPERGRRAAIIHYYESIKSLSSAQRNPLFWLQYGIACLVLKDFARSDKYFQTAYSLAKSRGWDTYQIDNHYARYLLVEVVDSRSVNRAMSSFRKARRIINMQVRDERKHYPYRVACHYEKFYDEFAAELDAEARAEIGRAAGFLLGRISKLPDERRRQRYVKNCRDAMEYVVEREREDRAM